MRRFVALAAVVALTGATASAQVAGMHRGMYFGTGIYQSGVSAMGEFAQNGGINVYPTGSNANPNGWGNFWHAADDPYNQGVVTYQLTGPTTGFNYEFVLFDTILPGTTQTFWSAPGATAFPANVTDITLNSDGHIVGIDSRVAPTPDQVVRLDLTNGTWSGTTLNNLPPNPGLGGFAYDRLSGVYYFSNGRTITTTNPPIALHELYSLNWNFGGLTTIASTPSTAIAPNWGGDLLQDGTWVTSSWVGRQYHTVVAGSNTWTSGPAVPTFTIDVSRERYSAPGNGYYAVYVSGAAAFLHQFVYVDAGTTPHTVTTLNTPTALPGIPGTAAILEGHALYNNDLCTVRTGKATWDINIRPDPVFSQYANRNYVVVACLTTPNRTNPITLPSGRELFLSPDPLTNLTVKGLAAPFIQNNIGVFDAFGNATAKIDLSLLRSNRQAVNGTVVHLAGIVLNPAAPEGVDWVLEPWAFVVNILP